jgi:DnaD/phage-associated family protein
MGNFAGFPDGKQRLVPVPEIFFQSLLPRIDSPAELKLILYVFYRLDQMEGSFRYLRRDEIVADGGFMAGLDAQPQLAEKKLEEALRNAVDHAVLITATLEVGGGNEDLYFLNSTRGRAAVQAIQRGEWTFSGDARRLIEVLPQTVNLFKLYEENIGPITPMIAEALKDMEASYPDEWIREAFRYAAENNKRNYRYIEAILRGWHERGRHETKDRRDTEKDRRKYADWEQD